MRERDLQAAVAMFLAHALPVDIRPDAETVIARFWARIDKSGGADACWPWLGSAKTTGNGYGYLSFGGHGRPRRNIYAHRLAIIIDGRTLSPEQKSCHSCDNPICENPAHLFAGTHADNMRDAAAKGRLAGWSRLPPTTRLDAASVREVRTLLDAGHTHATIASQFGVTASCIQHINVGRTWRHI